MATRINKADTPTAATQRVSGNGDRSTDRTDLCEYYLISLEFNLAFNCDYGNKLLTGEGFLCKHVERFAANRHNSLIMLS